MGPEDDARGWLRRNGYDDIADKIDGVMAEWKARGVTTRRNWWEVLAGDKSGASRVVGGVSFPVLAAARRRQGLTPVEAATERTAGEEAPVAGAAGRGAKRRTNPDKTRRPRTRQRQPAAVVSAASRHDKDTTRPDPRSALPLLSVRRFAQLDHIEVPSADLVALVGPQATGKSLVLELLKLALDRNRIVHSLRHHGLVWKSPEEFAALYFGGGFERSWTRETEVRFGNERLTLAGVAGVRARAGEDAVFYIPAHRTLAIAEGWPRSFAHYQIETPYVARRFSEAILTAINQGLVGKGKIFPHDRRLKGPFRTLIDDAVFHGAALRLDTLGGMRKQFVLEYSDTESRLPYMAWTAGQREFTPLLLGLYHLLPAGGGPKKREIQWAVLEEPEMGLHPKAVVAVMAVVLDLLARGYKVALSTHSPTVLEVIWGMSRLKGHRDAAGLLCKMMGLPSDRMVMKTAARALEKKYAVVHLQHADDGRVVSKDISRLDPGAEDPREWGWGGLTGFSAKVSEVIASSRAEPPHG